MSTQKGKWLLAGVMAISAVLATEKASADHGAQAVVTGLAIGVVAASLIDNDYGHRSEYREVHHYHNNHHYAPPRRYCPPRVNVVHEYHYDDHRHGHRHHKRHGHDRDRGGYYNDRGRSVIVNHF